jgi:uncharacterized protein YbjT (DUF2867 family)
MDGTILVTGATGHLGGAVADTLASRGFHVRAAVHRRAGKTFPHGVETVPFDYDDPDTFPVALYDVRGLFLVAPPLDAEAPRRVAPFLREARRLGRPHAVVVSSLDARPEEDAPLRLLERAVKDAGLPWTILRPTFFMENFSEGFLAPSIREKRSIFLPAEDGRTAFVSVHDVAAVAAAAFEGRRYGEEIDLTGPAALDHLDVAEILGEALGEEVRYVPLDEETFLSGARQGGMHEDAVQYLAKLYRAVREGRAELVSDGVERVAGRRPLSFREFARKNAGLWRKEKEREAGAA